MVCAQLQARLRDGHQRRSAPIHVCQRGQSRPKSFCTRRSAKTQVPCFGGLALPDNHLAKGGSLNQAERCPVESWALLMSTTSLNSTHPPVAHGYGTRLLACGFIMATACSVGAKAKMWQTGLSVGFLSATFNVDPSKHVPSTRCVRLLPLFQSPRLWVPCSSRNPAISGRRYGAVALIQRRRVVEGRGISLGGQGCFIMTQEAYFLCTTAFVG